MQKLAIDIVLLPDEKIQRICRELNADLSNKKIDFNTTKKTPHISLMMGCIEKEKIFELWKELSEIFKNQEIPEVLAHLEKSKIPQTGENIYYYEVDEKYIPKSIFEKLLPLREKYLSYDNISTNNFYLAEEVEEISTTWVQGFKNRSSEEYKSHITLGIGELLVKEYASSIYFSTPSIAIFQLGNYCTCENKLFENQF